MSSDVRGREVIRERVIVGPTTGIHEPILTGAFLVDDGRKMYSINFRVAVKWEDFDQLERYARWEAYGALRSLFRVATIRPPEEEG